MRTRLFFVWVAGLFANIGVLAAGTADQGDDSKKLQGEWVVVSAEFAGQKDELPLVRGVKLSIEGDRITFDTGRAEWTEQFRLDPAKTPKAIDLLTPGPNKAALTIRRVGIYQIDGDTLKLCWYQTGNVRPTEFATKKDTDLQLLLFKRAKKEQV